MDPILAGVIAVGVFAVVGFIMMIVGVLGYKETISFTLGTPVETKRSTAGDVAFYTGLGIAVAALLALVGLLLKLYKIV